MIEVLVIIIICFSCRLNLYVYLLVVESYLTRKPPLRFGRIARVFKRTLLTLNRI